MGTVPAANGERGRGMVSFDASAGKADHGCFAVHAREGVPYFDCAE